MSKEKDNANIAKETDKAKEAEEDNKVRVYGSVESMALWGFSGTGTRQGQGFGGVVGSVAREWVVG